MNVEQMKAATRKYFEGAFNKQDLMVFDEYLAPNVMDHALPSNMPQGAQGRKMLAQIFWNAFPDGKSTIDSIVAEGDRVVVRYTATGTHKGEFLGVPPTNKQTKATGFFENRFENGRVVEHWEVFDTATLIQQLGMMPPQGGAQRSSTPASRDTMVIS